MTDAQPGSHTESCGCLEGLCDFTEAVFTLVAAQYTLGERLSPDQAAIRVAELRHEVRQALADMLADWRSGRLTVSPGGRQEVLRTFSRRQLTGELAGVFRAAIAADNDRRTPVR